MNVNTHITRFQSAMPSLAQHPNRLYPPEHFLNSFPFPLTHLVAVMPRRAAINRATALTLGVLRNMGSHRLYSNCSINIRSLRTVYNTCNSNARSNFSGGIDGLTLGKAGTLHDRRLASARLHQDEEAVKALFNEIAPTQKERRGGYTRIVRLGQRQGDAAQLAILEFVDVPLPEAAPAEAAAQAETPAEKKEKKAEAKAESKAEEKQEAPAPA